MTTAAAQYMPGLDELQLPKMYRVEQRFDSTHIADVEGAIAEQFARAEIEAMLEPGRTVALAVGSRGIAHIDRIVRTAVDELKRRDVEVFIVPAMGSHGGATVEGQLDVLKHMGVTEEAMGAPIRSSMEAVEIGSIQSDHGNDVKLYMDKHAHDGADLIVPINRVKPHTAFKGAVESGICKMLCIGLGKHVGCSRLHREGVTVFDTLIPAAGKKVIETGKIGFALAIVENAYEQTTVVDAVPAAETLEREAGLLKIAASRMARFLMPRIDVLVVEEFRKNISGIGMDPNITGRGELGAELTGFNGPKIQRIVVLGLTDKTYGNAHGIGMADVITESMFDGIVRRTTWTNTLTAGTLACGRLPIAMPDERTAIMAAAACVYGVGAADARIVRIKNTLCMTEIAVSETLLEDVGATANCEVQGEWDGVWRGH